MVKNNATTELAKLETQKANLETKITNMTTKITTYDTKIETAATKDYNDALALLTGLEGELATKQADEATKLTDFNKAEKEYFDAFDALELLATN